MVTSFTDFKDDPYALRYGTSYTDKMKFLEKVMTTFVTGPDRFNVLNFEGGLGKSLHMLVTLDRYLSNPWNKRKFLIVKKFNTEIEKAVQFLVDRGHFDIVGITAQNWSTDWGKRLADLSQIRVLFISHERYMRLCLSTDREHFTKNRDVLIIDEKVIFPIYTFNKELYDSVRPLFGRPLQKEFDSVCGPLHDWIEKYSDKKNSCHRFRPKLHKNFIDRFKSLVHSNKAALTPVQRQTLDYFLQGLDVWYQTTCVHNAGNVSGVHPMHRHWGLENNLILDASASIDGVYKMNPENYLIINQELVIDHGNCRFNLYNFNTSKNNIRKHEQELFSEIVSIIKDALLAAERVLIICHKENAPKIHKYLVQGGIHDVLVHEKDKQYEDQQVVINWFGNIVGKNEYSKFEKCWLIGTPNLPFEQYLTHYVQYSKVGLGHKGMKLHNARFANETFKKVQTGYIAAEMYQALKRIQRVVEPVGEFNIVSSDREIIDMVLQRFKNSNQREELRFAFKDKKDAQLDEQRNRKVNQLYQHLIDLPKGKHRKKVIRDRVGIDQAHFSDYLKHEKVYKLFQEKLLMNHYRDIEKL